MGQALVHLVDDDAVVRSILAKLIVSGGYTVCEYASGMALLAAAAAIDGGYVLLDTDMPELDGFAVKAALADLSIDVPVIMMSGSGNLTVLAERAGFAQFLQKPFGRDELLCALAAVHPGRQLHG
jgi:two-component system response regulator FixJ